VLEEPVRQADQSGSQTLCPQRDAAGERVTGARLR
jgi:hypothetical protein